MSSWKNIWQIIFQILCGHTVRLCRGEDRHESLVVWYGVLTSASCVQQPWWRQEGLEDNSRDLAHKAAWLKHHAMDDERHKWEAVIHYSLQAVGVVALCRQWVVVSSPCTPRETRSRVVVPSCWRVLVQELEGIRGGCIAITMMKTTLSRACNRWRTHH
jgi:hypothetical protein